MYIPRPEVTPCLKFCFQVFRNMRGVCTQCIVFELNVLKLEAANWLLQYTFHNTFDFPRLESQIKSSHCLKYLLLTVQVSREGIYVVIKLCTRKETRQFSTYFFWCQANQLLQVLVLPVVLRSLLRPIFCYLPYAHCTSFQSHCFRPPNSNILRLITGACTERPRSPPDTWPLLLILGSYQHLAPWERTSIVPYAALAISQFLHFYS